METVVSVALLGIVMTAATTFFVNVLQSSSYLRSKQAATQLADDAMEQARAFEQKSLLTRRDEHSSDIQWTAGAANTVLKPYLDASQEVYDPTAVADIGLLCSVISTPTAPACLPTRPVTLAEDGLTYSTSTYIGSCIRRSGSNNCLNGDLSSIASTSDVGFYRVIVAVTWPAKTCPARLCTYVTAELQNVSTDPVFNLNTGSVGSGGSTNSALALTNPGDQATTAATPVSLQLLYKGGTGLVKWTGSMPSGLTLDADSGAVFGTPTCGDSAGCPVTVTGTDSVGPASTINFVWKVNATPAITAPTSGQVITSGNGAAITPVTATVSGGTPNFTWSARTTPPGSSSAQAGMPDGLSLDTSTGVITGTPTTNGTWGVTLTVTDVSTKTVSVGFFWKVISAIVNPGPQKLSVGDPVNLALSQHGLTSPTWSASTLPAGVTINAGSGVISGSPTNVEDVTTVVTAISGSQKLSMTFTWSVSGRIGAVGDLVGKCLDINGDSSSSGASAIAWNCGTQANQIWTNPADGTLRVTAGGQPRCLTANSGAAGAAVTSWPCSYPTLQTWVLTPVSGGRQITLSGYSPALCLDVSGTATDTGTALDLVSCSDTTRSTRTVWKPGS